MNFYYGMVDQENKSWGFIEETDPRVKPGMIFVKEDYWVQLLNEQSAGKEIVSDGTKVFTALPGKYYTDANGNWHEKSDEQINQENILVREQNFKNEFFEIPGYGWYRRVPKGYSSAVESVNTAFNAVAVLGSLPTGSLIFYAKPDFSDANQCTEEWLVANQIKNSEMDAKTFGLFYAAFIQAWNSSEHLSA